MKQSLRYGAVLGLIQVVWLWGGFQLLKALAGGVPHGKLRAITGLVGMVVLFFGVFGAIRREARTRGGLPYGQGLKVGALVSLTVAVIVALSSLLFVTVIAPGEAAQMIEEVGNAARQAGASPEEIARQLEGARREFSPAGQVAAAFVAQSVMGTLFSAVLAAFFRPKVRK